MSLVESVGIKIKQLREAHGLSQDELADSAGTTQVAIWRIETGKVGTNLKLLEKIAKQLDVEPAELLRSGSQQFSHGPKALLIELIPALDDTETEELLALAKAFEAARTRSKTDTTNQSELSPVKKNPHKP